MVGAKQQSSISTGTAGNAEGRSQAAPHDMQATQFDPQDAGDDATDAAGDATDAAGDAMDAAGDAMDAALDAMAAGDPAAAVDWFERVIATDPEHNEATHGLVRALEDAGRTEDALLQVKRLIARNPEDVLALTRLSMIYQHQGMVAEAEAIATRAKLLGWKLELRGGTSPRTTL